VIDGGDIEDDVEAGENGEWSCGILHGVRARDF